eukprot:jgi/Mesvir1/8108/Mv11218-RA.1
MEFIAAMSTRPDRKISDDTDLMSLLAWGVERGWSVSMKEDGDIVFDKGEEEREDDTAFARFVGGCESPCDDEDEDEEEEEEEEEERRGRKRRRTVFKSTERIPLENGKRLKLSIRITED